MQHVGPAERRLPPVIIRDCHNLLLWAVATGRRGIGIDDTNDRGRLAAGNHERSGRRTYNQTARASAKCSGVRARRAVSQTPFCAKPDSGRLPFPVCERRASMRRSNTKQVKAGRHQTGICQRKANCARTHCIRRRVQASKRNLPMRCSELRGTRDM